MNISNSMDFEEFKFLVEETAKKRKLSNAIVEKDFWVCWMLDYLFNKSYLEHSIIFKGGTSLSKGFGLIERFSEDIDIILDWRLLGYKDNEPWIARSNTKQDEFYKEIKTKTEDYLREVLLPKINGDIKNLLGIGFECFVEEDNKQVVGFKYKRAYESNYVVPYVRLEIGALSRWGDIDQVKITSYVESEFKEFFDESETYLVAVAPERTFWEKISILHREAHRPVEKECPSRYSRHYYDVYCLYNSRLNLLNSNGIKYLRQTMEFKQKFYRCSWARYDLAKEGYLKLIPPDYNLKFYREDYEKMKGMIYGGKPSFDEILDSIKELENKINAIVNLKNYLKDETKENKEKQDEGYEIGD